MHLPTIKQLNYLCAVAQTLHFGNAASLCHVSQSTLSSGIQELEDILGTVLIERSNKGVLLTALGKEIVQRSQNILTESRDLVSLCEASKEPLSSKMRIGVIPTIAPFVLAKLLNQLRKEYPNFHLFIREDLSDRLIHGLQNGDLDLLLVALPYPADNVETLHLFYDKFLLAYPKNHRIAEKDPLRTKNLKGQKLLLLEDGHCLRDHAMQACKLKNSDVTIPFQGTSLNTIVQMVANGIGITLLPKMALEAKILLGTTVKTRDFQEKQIHRSIGLMWRKKSPRESEFRLLGNFIKQHLSSG
jgi:LysR family hydrogen peroxide-inducible transcriptional activator